MFTTLSHNFDSPCPYLTHVILVNVHRAVFELGRGLIIQLKSVNN